MDGASTQDKTFENVHQLDAWKLQLHSENLPNGSDFGLDTFPGSCFYSNLWSKVGVFGWKGQSVICPWTMSPTRRCLHLLLLKLAFASE